MNNNIIEKYLGYVFSPIQKNIRFFVFMYALGVLCLFCAVTYRNLYLELFLDLYVACLLLTAIPYKVRRWVKAVLYVVLYATAVVDVYCFVKFNSTLTPTMLLLVGETDSREAGEFLRSYISADIIFSRVGWILLLMLVHIFASLKISYKRLLSYRQGVMLDGKIAAAKNIYNKVLPVVGLVTAVLLIWSAIASTENKRLTNRLFSAHNIGEVEHILTEPQQAQLYLPIYRLIFSIYSNELASKELDKLIAAADKVEVDSCSYTSPRIVLIIGESFSKRHSQQYGYFMPTTPRQIAREKTGLLTKFNDVVCPWNLTSFVFKNVFSMHVVGQDGTWADYPLFPELFRKAGYHVTFITNQFLPQAKEHVYDFSGGFFLNNSILSKAQFDTRNTQLHRFDEDLLKDYEQLKQYDTDHNLTIFHLIGQHVGYKQRYPRQRMHFTGNDYTETRPDLSRRERNTLADYDNACLYNDSVVNEIMKRFEDEDAIVIYMSDHGEECYEDGLHFVCRLHSAKIDSRLAHAEFDIPFWIWCSHKYAANHPDIYKQIVLAKNRRYMTDALPHLLLYLAGIHAKDYHEEYNLLSPKYNENRPRILKGTTDYDKL